MNESKAEPGAPAAEPADSSNGQKTGKLPVPLTPEGMTPPEFGEALGWPTGRAGQPSPAVGNPPSLEELDNLGVDEVMAEDWRGFYEYEANKNRSNPSAGPRRDFLIRYWKCSETVGVYPSEV
ncbi:DUF4951 domain-containing protein [Pyxidicoccus trucidator]|uniref:DUF4951 domain-containing protein n=1 Tax=Pyxidicoccus trucidator TaxID=2709662 RepID=UPI003B8353CC